MHWSVVTTIFYFYNLMSWGAARGQQTEYNTQKALNDMSGGYSRFSMLLLQVLQVQCRLRQR